jgi:hypothetical protein
VSLAALAGLLLLVWRGRRGPEWAWLRPRWLVPLALVLPLLALGGAWLAPEPPADPPRLTNPDGSQALVDSLPPGARPVDLAFTEPARLVGVHVPSHPGPDGLARVELYWRVEGPVPRAVGVYLQAEGPAGGRLGADHQALAGSFFLKDAPRDRLVRDVVALDLGRRKPGDWQVWVGLKRFDRPGSRLGAAVTGGARVVQDRFLAGTVRVPELSPARLPVESRPVR